MIRDTYVLVDNSHCGIEAKNSGQKSIYYKCPYALPLSKVVMYERKAYQEKSVIIDICMVKDDEINGLQLSIS